MPNAAPRGSSRGRASRQPAPGSRLLAPGFRLVLAPALAQRKAQPVPGSGRHEARPLEDQQDQQEAQPVPGATTRGL